jgi:molybdate transport system regulatory protein
MKNNNLYEGISLHYKIWLTLKSGEGIMGDGKWLLLKTIDKLGSLKAAADELKISYRKAWGELKKIESFINIPVLERQRGGKDGGNTILTDEGKKIVKAYDKFHKETNVKIEKAFEKFLIELQTK